MRSEIAGNRPAFNYNDGIALTGTYVEFRLERQSALALCAWADMQKFPCIEPPEDMHTTIMYSPEIAIPPACHYNMPLVPKYTLTNYATRRLDVFGPQQDCIVMCFQSLRFASEHKRYLAMGCLPDYPDYKPHITIAKGDFSAGLLSDIKHGRIRPPDFPLDYDRAVCKWVNSN